MAVVLLLSQGDPTSAVLLLANIADGESGQVVISNLVNRASVLINYPMGDLASRSPAACSCGRSFQLISELEGRTEDILEFEGGRYLHPRMVWQIFKDERQVLQYQLIEHENQRFELQLVCRVKPRP